MGFAGIWDRKVLDNGEELLTCAIITTPATSDLQHIHERMPLILANSTECQEWLVSDDASFQLKAYKQVQNLSYTPVSKRINGTQFNDPDLIKKEEPISVQNSLFEV